MENREKGAPKKKAEKTPTSSAAIPKVPEEESPIRGNEFPVVGIGASAGGLEGFRQFFDHMPADSGMAFVLLTHFDPTHLSMLSGILGRNTKMNIVEAGDGTRVEPNHVYVIPPNKRISIVKSTLFLFPQEETRTGRMPIDFFLSSLAEDLEENGVGVILSGTGSDGIEIKELLREFLIPVTTFFRDPKAFIELKSKALPMILDRVSEKEGFRAWVPGCSTGEAHCTRIV